MRILHTSDWHIGKKVNEFSMIEDQRYVFEQIYEIIKSERIDVVLVAGDLYDKPIVGVDSIKLLDEILFKIINECNAKIILVSGNHDSPDRISFVNKFLENSGIYIEGKFNKEVNKIVLNDEFGEVNFYPLSYFDELHIRHIYDDESIKNSNDALKAIMNNIDVDYTKRNVFIGHGYFSNKDGEKLIESDSERKLSIGGQEVMDASILENFDYVALGHLHANQKVIHDYIRYSGSILKYSFSEMNHIKSVTIVEMFEKGNLNIRQIELRLRHDMREIEGYINTLTSKDFYSDLNLEDYYRIILHDSIGISDPANRLRKIYKNLMEIQFKDFGLEDYENQEINNSDVVSKSPFDLFSSFYKSVSGKDLNETQIDILKGVLKEANELEMNDY